MVCPSAAWPAQGPSGGLSPRLSLGGGSQAYAGAVVIALAPLASLASSVVNFKFSAHLPG